MKSFVCALLFCLSFGATTLYAHSSGHGHPSAKSHKGAAPKKQKPPKSSTEHVNGYTRRDGTVVSGYDRGTSNSNGSSLRVEPGTSTHPRTNSVPGATFGNYQPYRTGHLAAGYKLDPTVQRGMFGKIKRSGAAKDAFKRAQPCPSNGNTSGKCPGYVIDHVRPLECGGADAPSNMQWQTIAAGKAKDKTERACRL